MSTAFYGRSGEDDFLATFDDDSEIEDMYEDLLDYITERGFTSIEYIIGVSTVILDSELNDMCDQLKLAAFKWED